MSEPRLFLSGRVTLHLGDCLDVLASLPESSVDAVVTDPPYHLTSIVKRFGAKDAAPAKSDGATGVYARGAKGFMGQTWDGGDIAFRPEMWGHVLRVLKPGGHLVAFSGTRTYHRMASAIEDSGFEIRDAVLDMLASDAPALRFLETLSQEQVEAFVRCLDESAFGGMLGWVYGSGFPKSHDVSKGIDRKNGDARPVVGTETLSNDIRGGALLDAAHDGTRRPLTRDVTTAASAASAAWQGWGTALKPAWEPICLARKPLDGTVAANVLKWGVGGLNIDGCRVVSFGGTSGCDAGPTKGILGNGLNGCFGVPIAGLGRFPANLVHDGSADVCAAFPKAAGQQREVNETFRPKEGTAVYGNYVPRAKTLPRADAGGSAARFFYTAKADADDRIGSKHPTVKPVDLMRWLVRLVCPKGGTVLDPFAGTGTTGEAAVREGMTAVLVERDAAYAEDIARRMALAEAGPTERRSAIAKAARQSADHGPLFGMPPAEAAE